MASANDLRDTRKLEQRLMIQRAEERLEVERTARVI
jgi:hypothetical protein